MEPTSLPLTRIRRDGGTQLRAASDAATIAEYSAALAAGAVFPPVTVFYDGQDHWLADGFHRLAAAEQAGLTDFPAEVRPGTCRDAVLFAAGANAVHGLRRSHADKRACVRALLTAPEWSTWSDRLIARQCGVHHDLVGELRQEISGGNRQMDRRVRRSDQTYLQRRRSPTPLPPIGKDSPPAIPESVVLGSRAAVCSQPLAGDAARARLPEAARILASVVAPHSVRPDEWWRLGEHRLYAGAQPGAAALERFRPVRLFLWEPEHPEPALPPARLAVWQEWCRRAEITAVVGAAGGLPLAFQVSTAPYLGTLACVRDDALPLRAPGEFWSPVVLFGSLTDVPLPDVVRVSSLTGSSGSYLSLELAVWLLEGLTFPGDLVFAGGRGAETALLAAELTGRRCVGLGADEREAGKTLSRWEALTGGLPELELLGRI